MTLPLTPPTDTLHKFLAIGGVALLCVSFGYPTWVRRESDLQRAAVTSRRTSFNAEKTLLFKKEKEALDSMHSTAGVMVLKALWDENGKPRDQPLPLPPEVEKEWAKYQAATREVAAAKVDLIRKKLEAEKELREAEVTEEHAALAGKLGILGVALGCVLAFLGFRTWYLTPAAGTPPVASFYSEWCQWNRASRIMTLAGVILTTLSAGVPRFLAYEVESRDIQETTMHRAWARGMQPILIQDLGYTIEELELPRDLPAPPAKRATLDDVFEKIIAARPDAQAHYDKYLQLERHRSMLETLSKVSDSIAFWASLGLPIGIVLTLVGLAASRVRSASPAQPPSTPMQLPPSAASGEAAPDAVPKVGPAEIVPPKPD